MGGPASHSLLTTVRMAAVGCNPMVARGLLAVEASTPKMGAWTAELRNVVKTRGGKQELSEFSQAHVK